MGIGERGQLFPTTDELLVRPNLGQLLPAWSRQQKELSESSDHRQSRPGLFDDEFHRIREYRAGDNPRSIHWRSTARRGELMIREHHQNRHSDSLVLLDLPEIGSWTNEESEMAISLAATICAEQTRSSSGSRYVLAIASKEPVFIASRSPAGFREEALDALAICERSPRASLADIIASVVSGHTLSDERMILITPRVKQAEDALNAASKLYLNNSTDLIAQTTIVPASSSELQKVFKPDWITEHRESTAKNKSRTQAGSKSLATLAGGAK
jgi:uncharacterized protein (DUF58 family)